MSADPHKKHSAHPLRKKILGVLLRVILAILFLEFLVYFGSNIFLAEYAQRKVNEATEDVYIVEFNRINFSLIRRGIFLNGLVMRPVNPESRKEGQTLFDFKLDEVGISGLWYDFSDHDLTIGSLYLDNPNIALDIPGKDSVSGISSKKGQFASPVKLLENEIRKSLGRISLVGLLIREIEINHANGFFFQFLSKENLIAENTSLVVRNVDWTTLDGWETPFNAKGFEFNLEKARYPLNDGVHTVLATTVSISSLDKVIDIRDFVLSADHQKDSETYYDVKLEKLLLGNVDLNQAFMTSELLVDELILNDPEIKVVSNPGQDGKKRPNGDLNDFIQDQLKSVRIKELSVNQGKFSRSTLGDSLKNRIELGELNFKMVGFYLGEDPVLRQDQFFYGKEAAMEIKEGSFFLGDGVHVLTGTTIEVSSFKDELLVKNLSLSPRVGLNEQESSRNLYQIKLPELVLDAIDLKKLYNEGVFSVEEVRIVRPEVEVMTRGSSSTDAQSEVFSDFVSGFLESVSVKKLQVEDGQIQFTDETGRKANDIGFDQFSFLLSGLRINPDPSLPIYEQFYSEEIFISLDNYLLKLRDNLHLFEAGNLTLDSRSNLVQITDLKISPESKDQINLILERTGKTAAIDFSVPLFRAEGIDISQAIFEQNLEIAKIILPEPEFSITVFQKTERLDERPQSTEDVRGLLLGYFDRIHVDSIILDQAKIDFQSGKSRVQEDDFLLKLKNFSIYPGDSTFSEKTLFSEEIDLTFNNYLFTLTGGKYLVAMDRMNYNSREETILLDGLKLQPGPTFNSRIALGLDFPKMELKGVDIEQFVFENILDLRKIEVNRGKVEIGIDQDVKQPVARSKSGRSVRTIEQIDVDTIWAKESFLELKFLGNNQSRRSIETGFEFLIRQFHLDTLAVDRSDLGSLYSSANVNLDNFVFALPDSVHTVSFSNLVLGDERDELVFEDFAIIPKDQAGKTGEPVVEAFIEELGVVSNKFPEIIESKTFDLRALRLSGARVNLYLDEKLAQKPPTKITASTSSQSLIKALILNDLKLENGKIQVFKKESGPINGLDLGRLNFSIENLDWDLMSQSQKMDLHKLFSRNFGLELADYRWYSQDSAYRFDVGGIDFTDDHLILSKILVRPTAGIYGHLKKSKSQTDILQGEIGRIRLDGISLIDYLEENKLNFKSLTVDGASLDIFRDKRMPFDSMARRYMVQHLMRNAKLDADIGSVHVQNSHVRYFEFAPKGNLPGMISFENIQMDMAPFYLRKNGSSYPLERLRAGIRTDIMGISDVQLTALMRFEEKSPMDVSIEMGEFDLVQINDFLEKTLFVKIDKGRINNGNWEFTLDDDFAIGEMRLAYEDLKIQLVDSLTYEQGKGKLKLFTFFVNVVAKNNNPRGSASRIVVSDIYQERDKSKFIFNAWWKATLSGLRGSFGLGKPKIPKERRKEEED